jgi:hypothetical protein
MMPLLPTKTYRLILRSSSWPKAATGVSKDVARASMASWFETRAKPRAPHHEE